MRDRGGQSKKPAKGTLKNTYHLRAYGYKPQSGFHPRKLLESIGLTGLAHPIRRLQHPGGAMAFPGDMPKLPPWMAKPVTKELDPFGMGQERTIEHMAQGGVTPFDKAIGGMRAHAPAREIINEPGGRDPRGSFLEHLALLHDPEANRAFLDWMMTHHYKRPN